MGNIFLLCRCRRPTVVHIEILRPRMGRETTTINANNSREIEFLNKMNLKIFMLLHIVFCLIPSFHPILISLQAHPSLSLSFPALLHFIFMAHTKIPISIVVCSLFTTSQFLRARLLIERSRRRRDASYPTSTEQQQQKGEKKPASTIQIAKKKTCFVRRKNSAQTWSMRNNKF